MIWPSFQTGLDVLTAPELKLGVIKAASSFQRVPMVTQELLCLAAVSGPYLSTTNSEQQKSTPPEAKDTITSMQRLNSQLDW